MPPRRRFLVPLVLAVCLLGVTEIPYALGRAASPPGHRFDGHLYYLDDLNMYFSFIRQAAEGRWLFANRLTHVPHEPAFFNLEWLVVGKVMAAAGGSDRVAFTLWRAAGVAALVFGFTALAAAVGLSGRRRDIALIAFATGGGFGWLVQALETTGLVPRLTSLPALYWKLDLIAGVHPFLQMTLNPHFSLPHGLLLLFLAAFLVAERTQRPRDRAVAASAAAVLGFVRPYDLIALWAALPLYALVRADRADLKRTSLGLLPLLTTAPALAYHAWLFGRHPVFSHWAKQGALPRLPLTCHVLGMGLFAGLCAWRLIRRRHALEGNAERLLLVWTACVMVLIHAHALVPVVPYSAQLMTSTMAPLVLLAAPVLPLTRRPVLALLLAVNALSSGVLLADRARAVAQPGYHQRPAERLAFEWLATHAAPTDVILSRRDAGNRLGRHVSARLVLAHYSVTPDATRLEGRVEAFFDGTMAAGEAAAFLRELGVRWIYRPLDDTAELRIKEVPGVERAYQASGVAIYSVAPSAHSRSGGSAQARGGRFASAVSVPLSRTRSTRTSPRV